MIHKQEATAIFDIGRTNKKFFLFDHQLKEVYKVYHRLPYTTDDDGESCESLHDLVEWIRSVIAQALAHSDYKITKLNFTSYGASMVHLNNKGKPAAPLYNYLKGYPENLMDEFYQERGGREAFCQETASPPMGMLNAGLQLYRIKKEKPGIFRNIDKSLCLPQFLSCLFTGEYVSEFTSIGCHTALWNFTSNHFHDWLRKEEVSHLVPPIVISSKRFRGTGSFHNISVGVGIHDSSAALLPYLMKYNSPFVLLSTGTWAISINPFNQTPLSAEDLRRDCLQFLSVTGNPVKASRLFIGEEHKYQVEQLYSFFNKPQGTYKKLKFDPDVFKTIKGRPKSFHFKFLKPSDHNISQSGETAYETFNNFEEAYYTFINELTDLQVASLKLVIDDYTEKLFVDGGFNANDVFLGMLQHKLAPMRILTCDFALGSALGAALMVQDESKLEQFSETLPVFSEFGAYDSAR